jgi:hypothetical protein
MTCLMFCSIRAFLYSARNFSLFSAHCAEIGLNCVTWFRNPVLLLQCVWPVKSSWPMSKIAAQVSIVSDMKIPGPMLGQPVYCCDHWLAQNAYIAVSAAGPVTDHGPVMLQYCGLMPVQVNRPATRKYLLQLLFQLTQNSTRTTQSSLHCSCKGTDTVCAARGIAAYKGATTASALCAGERLASRSGHLIPTGRASLTYFSFSGGEYKYMSLLLQLCPCT